MTAVGSKEYLELWIISMSLLSKCGCSSGFAKELIIYLL